MFDARLENIKKANPGYWATRIASELEYAHELSKLAGGNYDTLISDSIAALDAACGKDAPLGKAATLEAEAALAPLHAAAKSYRLLCAGHAHIDMNWMWRWDETVSVALDTFRTVLDLMAEYPDFKFSQSQASVYQILENYAPAMLDAVRARVHEGRWEVTASTWVENDKNMPSGESLARHILYTRRYLSALLGIDADTLTLDFEPDTFGHSANVPEILAAGGVRYYYHCRGSEGPHLYRWIAPSGRSVIAQREPFWYLGPVDPAMAIYVPAWCAEHGLNTMMRVYGVGDHGGGPTRRDIERILDMNTWPIFPTVHFGTMSEYFASVEAQAPALPEVHGEMNCIFTGCYTSQSAIKKANSLAENTLGEAEAFGAWAKLAAGLPYPAPAITTGWRNTLFNQFHDIIPGSGVADTRHYALGLFQQTLAAANTHKMASLRAIAGQIDTASLLGVDGTPRRDSIAEGAGVGFGVEDYRIAQSSRGAGAGRVFHVFNALPAAHAAAAEIVLWDWDGDLRRLVVRDAAGATVAHQLVDRGFNDYWGHKYLRLLAAVDVPAGGYNTYTVTEDAPANTGPAYPLDPRVEASDELSLENEYLRAEFDPYSCALVSLIDKSNGEQLLDKARGGAAFRYIEEDDRRGMTAWTVGRYMNVRNLTERAHVVQVTQGAVRQSVTFETVFGNQSKLTVTVVLDAGSRRLDINAECDWHEIGRKGQGVPQLNFWAPLAFNCRSFRYDVPFGVVERECIHQDVPALSLAQARRVGGDKHTVALLAEGKHGFRGSDDALAVTLIRSSYDPDPYPEVGVHKMRLALALSDASATNSTVLAAVQDFVHPLTVFSGSSHAGDRPASTSFVALERGTASISAIKLPEDGDANSVVVRLYETEGQDTTAMLRFWRPVASAQWLDVNEKPLSGAGDIAIEGAQVAFPIAAAHVATLQVTFL
jgi:alpha-mannosidase